MDELLRSHRNPLYRAWRNILNRCRLVSHPDYPDYGGRGIMVCQRWQLSFDAFVADLGPRPSPQHSVDRRDTNGPYSPDNCRWATREEQARNKRSNRLVTFAGETLPMVVWAERRRLSLATLHARLKAGWTPEEALTRPLRNDRRRKVAL